MAPRWPQVNNGPENINEHATYLKEACNQLQALDRGRQNQVPWNIVQQYVASTVALIGKVLSQPAIGDILQHVQDAAKCTQSIQKDLTIIKNSVVLSTTPRHTTNFTGRAPLWPGRRLRHKPKAHQPSPANATGNVNYEDSIDSDSVQGPSRNRQTEGSWCRPTIPNVLASTD